MIVILLTVVEQFLAEDVSLSIKSNIICFEIQYLRVNNMKDKIEKNSRLTPLYIKITLIFLGPFFFVTTCG